MEVHEVYLEASAPRRPALALGRVQDILSDPCSTSQEIPPWPSYLRIMQSKTLTGSTSSSLFSCSGLKIQVTIIHSAHRPSEDTEMASYCGVSSNVFDAKNSEPPTQADPCPVGDLYACCKVFKTKNQISFMGPKVTLRLPRNCRLCPV